MRARRGVRGRGRAARVQVSARTPRKYFYCQPRPASDGVLQGNPYTGCIQGECDENADCGPQRACKDYKCGVEMV